MTRILVIGEIFSGDTFIETIAKMTEDLEPCVVLVSENWDETRKKSDRACDDRLLECVALNSRFFEEADYTYLYERDLKNTYVVAVENESTDWQSRSATFMLIASRLPRPDI